VLMKDFYTGMDRVRAIFRDDARIKNSQKIEIMAENATVSQENIA